MTENSYLYSRAEMPATPGRRTVETIEGSSSVIATRASTIIALGDKMAKAAATLQLFADGAVGKGKSFDAIREQAKEVHQDLKTAAQRYRPSGVALQTYSAALSTVRAETGWRISGAEQAWEEVRLASKALSDADDQQSKWDHNDRNDVDQTGTRPSTWGEQSTFDTAVENWEYYWSGYDAPVETWEAAYNTAVSSLEKANSDGVRDSFWDNSMPFVEMMLDVLLVVGIILLVVAFVVSGPLALLAGVLAAVAGVLSLMGEIAKLNAGRGDWGSVALAVVGIIPFGKLAKLGSFIEPGVWGKLTTPFRIAGDEFAAYGSKLDDFLRVKVGEGLFHRVGPRGEFIPSVHGDNSRNLMRMLHTPEFLFSGNSWVGGWRKGWEALAGNPTNAAEAFGGAADLYTNLLGTAKDLSEKLAPSR